MTPRAEVGSSFEPTIWVFQWETAVPSSDHEDLACLLGRAFPQDEALLVGTRSWVGARPELRVTGRRGEGVVAHAGIVRRFLRAVDSDEAVLVGDVGLVAVDPEARGEGMGAQLTETVAATLHSLDPPFGFLTCDPHVRPFYERCGWTALDHQVLHSISVRQRLETSRRNGMVLAVRRSLAAWPTTNVVERNGQEL